MWSSMLRWGRGGRRRRYCNRDNLPWWHRVTQCRQSAVRSQQVMTFLWYLSQIWENLQPSPLALTGLASILQNSHCPRQGWLILLLFDRKSLLPPLLLIQWEARYRIWRTWELREYFRIVSGPDWQAGLWWRWGPPCRSDPGGCNPRAGPAGPESRARLGGRQVQHLNRMTRCED